MFTFEIVLGALSPLIWSFEAREMILSLFDFTQNSRFHLAFFTISGVSAAGAPDMRTFEYITFLIKSNLFLLEILELTCINNKIVYLRLRGIGVFDFFDISYNSISGVLARATGIAHDCRLIEGIVNYFNLVIYTATTGDSLARFILRIYDSKQATAMLLNIITVFNNSPMKTNRTFSAENTIENIIFIFWNFFCIVYNGVGISAVSIETPKGEMSVCLLIFNSKINRCRIRCADFIHVLLLDVLSKGYLLGDLVAIIGNIDCVFGSVDR